MRYGLGVRGGEGLNHPFSMEQKVIRQMNNKKDIVHSFPKSVDGYANKYGQRTINVGKDGKTYQWLKLNGSYRGKTGTFEYIKDNKGVINHRYFKISK